MTSSQVTLGSRALSAIREAEQAQQKIAEATVLYNSYMKGGSIPGSVLLQVIDTWEAQGKCLATSARRIVEAFGRQEGEG